MLLEEDGDQEDVADYCWSLGVTLDTTSWCLSYDELVNLGPVRDRENTSDLVTYPQPPRQTVTEMELFYKFLNKSSFPSSESGGVEAINLLQCINHREVTRRTRGVDVLMILVIL